jgi:hypothetical protein
MSKLIALLALAGALAAALFFWRKKEGSWESMWSTTSESASSWGKTVAQEASHAGDAFNDAAHEINDLAHELSGATVNAAKKVDEAGKKVSAAKAEAEAASVSADEVDGEPPRGE